MIDLSAQAIDIDYIKTRLIIMQKEQATGQVLIKFESGVVQIVETSVKTFPPSRKLKKEQKNS